MYRPLQGACALLAFVAFGPAGVAHAQTLTGRLTDGETGAPLPGASVVLPTLDLGTASDADGRYTLALPARGTYRVVYRIDEQPRTVTVLDVAHRHDAYRA